VNVVDRRVTALIKQVITWVVTGNHGAIEARSAGLRLSADSIRRALVEYGRTLIMPPESAFENADVIPVSNADRPTWSVRFELWTEEEGRSDLSIEFTIADRGDALLDLEVDNVHVM
jgi:hypothetical protein